jgi:hypothetical protein
MILWMLTSISVLGAILNILHLREGFYLWMVCNFFWAVVDVEDRNWQRAALFTVYLGLSFWGAISWGK